MGSDEVAPDGVAAAVQYRRRTTTARVVVVALVLVLPLVFGARVHGIPDDDMAPVLRAGDAVVTWPISPADASPGDLVMFRDPQDPDRRVTRRVVEVAPMGPIVAFETRGHATDRSELRHVGADERIGAVGRRIPLLGAPLSAVTSGVTSAAGSAPSRAALLAILIVPALGLAVVVSHITASTAAATNSRAR